MSAAPPEDLGIKVTIVEDHGLLAQSLAVVLGSQGMTVDVRPDPSPAAVEEAIVADPPDVVLLDLDLGGGVTTLPIIPRLVATGTLVILVTGVTDRERLAECVEAGAVGIVPKGASFARLAAAITEAMTRRTLFAPGERDALLRELREHREERDGRLRAFASLTPRERDVLGALVEGKSAEQIAGEDFVSLNTARTHIRTLLSKLEVRSQLAAVALAKRAGWRHEQ